MNNINEITYLLNVMEKNISGYWLERSATQIKFVIEMIKAENLVEENLLKAFNEFYEYYKKEGNITKTATIKLEEHLLYYSKYAKEYEILCVAHAHIDMNWMWSYQETVAITLDTMRTMLNLMDEYPDFKFSQSQASIYEIVEKFDPNMLLEIKKRITEGRWEVTASTWVEADHNMISGESMVQHIVKTREYLTDMFDLSDDYLNLCFVPDTFGHNINIPEVLAKSGIKYYYHCRGHKDDIFYNWKSPSGAEILVYKEPDWYLGFIKSDMGIRMPKICKENGIKCKTGLEVYGVGDHGGGPTRFDLEKMADMSSWPIYPKIKQSTYKEFFTRIEKYRDNFNTIEHELNYIFTGCYTSQSRIKMANKISEKKLVETAIVESMAKSIFDIDYQSIPLTRGWKNTLFNHFHDILPGSCIIDSREHAMGLFQETVALTNTETANSLRKICENIDTSSIIVEDDLSKSFAEGAGTGYGIEKFSVPQTERGRGKTRIFHVFNQLPHMREEVVTLTIWNYYVDEKFISVKDNLGNDVLFQIREIDNVGINGKPRFFGHSYIELLIHAKVPPMGFTSYIVTQENNENEFIEHVMDIRKNVINELVLENEFIKAKFDSISFNIVSLFDKENNMELLNAPSGLKFLSEDINSMTSWTVGRYKREYLLGEKSHLIKFRNSNPIRNLLSYSVPFENSDAVVEISLDKNSRMLKYDVKVNWREYGSDLNGVPRLNFALNIDNPMEFKYDIPFGIIKREAIDDDVPALSFANAKVGNTGIMICSPTKYGFRGYENNLSLSLIRSSYDPDTMPENCVHDISFAVCVGKMNDQEMMKIKNNYLNPLLSQSNSVHGGKLEMECFGAEIIGEGVIMESAIYQDGGIIFRLFEINGQDSSAKINFNKDVKSACIVDFFGKEISGYSKINNNTVEFGISHNSVINIFVKL